VFKSLEARGLEVLKWMFTAFEVGCSKSLKLGVQVQFKDGDEATFKLTFPTGPPAGTVAALAPASRASGAGRRAAHP